MHNKLIEYFSKITQFSSEERNALIESMDVKTLKKNDFILKENQHNKNTFFILKGLVRQFEAINGEEVTTNFYREGQWIISLTSFSENPISQDNLLCIEETAIVIGNEEKAQELFKKFPRLETVSRIVLETVFAEQHKWMMSYLTDTPEKRYLKLLETQPDIFQKVPQYHIASYIGVKPESLSRIRKRILKNL